MFELERKTVKLISAPGRKEFCGESKRVAQNLDFKIKLPNEALDMFDPNLKSMFYREDPSGQTDVTGDHRTILRNNKIGVIPWKYKGAGYGIVIEHGEIDKEELQFADAKLTKISFQMHEGGNVTISFTVSVYPNPTEHGTLYEWSGDDVVINLVAPEVEEDLTHEDADEKWPIVQLISPSA